MSIPLRILHDILHLGDHIWHGRRTVDEGESNKRTEHRFPWLERLEQHLIERQLDQPVLENPAPIPTMECSTETFCDKTFVKLSKGLRHPVVLKGLINDFPCVKLWSLEYLQDMCGDCDIPVITDATQQLNLGGTPVEYMSFRDVVKGINQKEPLYVNNISAIFDHNPILQEQLMQSRTAKALGGVTGFNPAQAFIGAEHTRTDFHCAMLHNMFYNIKGRKKWVFVSPKYSYLMKGAVARSGMYAVSQHSNFANQPDLFRHIPMLETTLDEGDVLFNPSFWWHAVINESPYTVGVANRLVNKRDWLGIANMVIPNLLYAFEMFFFGQHIKSAMFKFNHKDLDKSITDDFSR